MQSSSRPFRQIICEVCNRHTRTQLKSRDICSSCYHIEPSSLCKRCNCMKRQVSEETGLCPRCTQVASVLQGACRCCLKIGALYDLENSICKNCITTLRRQERNKVKQNKINCSVCGETRSSALVSRSICQACLREENNGRKVCEKCHKVKVIFNKAKQACKQCNKELKATNSFNNYINNFNSPYPYNDYLFRLLTAKINKEDVSEKVNQRFRIFGRFLQSHQLPQPLTWEIIEANLPELGSTNRYIPKLIRSCLLELGHILAAAHELENWDIYVAKRNALKPLISSPEHIKVFLERFVQWLWEQKHTATDVRDYLESLTAFWSWCENRSITSSEQIQPSLVNDYLLALYWQWQCSVCDGTVTFEPCDREALKECPHCNNLTSLRQVKRYAQNTVRQHRSKLFVFFDWVKNNRQTLINPVQRKVAAPSPTIEHYPPEVIKQLCDYIREPNADPTEALILYLIIFHALSVSELRYAQIPSAVPLRKDIPLVSLSNAYYLILPAQSPSTGRRSPGRPNSQLDFPIAAASWLKPLLERFEVQRKQVLQGSDNQYLLIQARSVRHNKPIGNVTIWKLVQQASLKVLGAACNPNTLRKTAGIMFADRAGGAILHWLGWEAQQAFGYTWMSREVKYPKQLKGWLEPKQKIDEESIDFPSTTEF